MLHVRRENHTHRSGLPMARSCGGGLVALLIFSSSILGQDSKPEPRRQTDTTLYQVYLVGEGRDLPLGEPWADEDKAQKSADKWNEINPVGEFNRRHAIVKPVPGKASSVSQAKNQQPEQTPAKPATEMPGGAAAKKLIRVVPLKQVDGKLQRQADQERVFSIDDYEKASEFYWATKAKDGYSAWWYDSQGRQPKIVGGKASDVNLGATYKAPERIEASKPKKYWIETRYQKDGGPWHEWTTAVFVGAVYDGLNAKNPCESEDEVNGVIERLKAKDRRLQEEFPDNHTVVEYRVVAR